MFKFGSIQSVVSNNNTDQKRYFWAHKITVNLIYMRIICTWNNRNDKKEVSYKLFFL